MSAKIRIALLFSVFMVVMGGGGRVWGQDKDVMSAYDKELKKLFGLVFTASTDNERYNANEQVVQLFENALEQEGAFYWKWDFGRSVSVLTSSDRKFRVITWPVVRDNGEYECFGFVQAYNEKTENFDVWVLNDKSDEIMNAEESVLGPENWFGTVYQELIETKHEGKEYYTLIGWSGVNNLTQRKVIEPICFRSGSSKPQFGQALFRREKNLRRVVFEYSRNAMVNVRYDDQFTRTVVNKKVKGKKGRIMNVQEAHDTKGRMIIFDEIAPMLPGMEGLFHTYVPTGTELAYIFREGKWELNNKAQGRSSDPSANKNYDKPLQKSAPAYKVEN